LGFIHRPIPSDCLDVSSSESLMKIFSIREELNQKSELNPIGK